MDFYDVVDSRRTIRDFRPAELDDGTISRIIGCGMKAPSNDHMRDWHFIVVRDKAVAQKLLGIIPDYTESDVQAAIRDWNLDDPCQQEAYRNAIPKQRRMLAEASCIVAPLFRQKTDVLNPENLSHLNGFASIWCCIENIFLAVTAEGLACTLRVPLGKEGGWSRKVLNYPAEYLMPCLVGIGKPAEDAEPNRQKAFLLEERVHWNGW